MGAGLPKFATINLGVLGMHYQAGEEVTLESLRQKRLLNVSGREAKLPLKVGSASRTARVTLGRALEAPSGILRTTVGVSACDALQRWQSWLWKEHFSGSQVLRSKGHRAELPKQLKSNRQGSPFRGFHLVWYNHLHTLS